MVRPRKSFAEKRRSAQFDEINELSEKYPVWALLKAAKRKYLQDNNNNKDIISKVFSELIENIGDKESLEKNLKTIFTKDDKKKKVSVESTAAMILYNHLSGECSLTSLVQQIQQRF